MQYLALSALDFVMERSAIEGGATTTGAKPPGHHLPDSQGLMTCL